MRYFLHIAYVGTRFAGWQRLHGIPSVQGEIEMWLSRLYNQPIVIKGSGRTDAGVHAAGQVAHVDLPDSAVTTELIHKLNRVLPADIALTGLTPVLDDVHARHSAVARTYRYRVHFGKDPFLEPFSWQHRASLDMDKMNASARLLIGEQSFRGLSKEMEKENHYLCRLTYAEWQPSPSGLDFVITANRFLRGMVRATVGALCKIGQEGLSPDWLAEVLKNENGVLNAPLAPPHGLTLESVEYPVEVYR